MDKNSEAESDPTWTEMPVMMMTIELMKNRSITVNNII